MATSDPVAGEASGPSPRTAAAQDLRIRRDVWSLDDWDPTLLWYARAVRAMQARPAQDQTSWSYQAAVHGRNPPGQNRTFWNQCQHQTWYFLPWHRGYLVWFEQIVQAAITQLGGPADWALPYWNYSDGRNPNARVLPPAFRASQLPDGTPNPLRVASRFAAVNAGQPIGPSRDVTVAALDLPRFRADAPGASPGFGGPATGFQHAGGRNGGLEAQPHNVVHNDVGGLMRSPATSAQDPIFWLHHANVDRLWEIWRQDPAHTQPTAANWRNLQFSLHDAERQVVTFTPAQMLDTTAPPLLYRYDSLTDPRAPAARREAVAAAGDEEHKRREEAAQEMVGATTKPIELGAVPTSARVAVEAPSGPVARALRQAPGRAPRVFLNVENIMGTAPSTNYDVYVNLPADADPEAHEDLIAGVLSTFGVERASSSRDDHGGAGLHVTFDITELVAREQAQGIWKPDELQVSFVPRHPDDDLPPLTVGRVSVYYQR